MQDKNNLTFNYIIFIVLSMGVIFGYAHLFRAIPKEERTVAAGQAPATEKKPIKQAVRESYSAKADIGAESMWNMATNKGNGAIEIETPLYRASVDMSYGSITRWELKNYKDKPDETALLNMAQDPAHTPRAVLSIEKDGRTEEVFFNYDGNKVVSLTDGLAREVVLSSEQNGIRILKTLSFDPTSYLVNGKYEVINKSAKPVEYAIHFLQRGEIKGGNYGPTDSLVVSLGGKKKVFTGAEDVEQRLEGSIDWLGFSKKYFISSILPESGEKTVIRTKQQGENSVVSTRFSYGRFSVRPEMVSTRQWKMYLGPKRESLLSGAGYGLENSIDYGWFETLSKIAVKVLKYTNGLFNNYGVSIIVITVLFKLLFLPLSVRGSRAMKAMQKKMESVKPKIDALKEKHKNNRTKLNEETMKMYSSHGINPLSSLGGCLPMLAQVPVFIALYYGLLYSIELRHSSFLWINDLSAPENLFNIPGTSLPFRPLPLAMGVSWWFSTKLTPMTATGDAAAMQAKIMQFMPVIFTFVMWDFPAGLVLYWTASNILTIVQQLYINRTTA